MGLEPTQTAAAVHNPVYQQIAPWQTRLIKLLPGHFDDSVTCDLHVVDLIAADGVGLTGTSEVVHYEALSYSWGHPDCTAMITCNRVSIGIPPAMLDALRYLRLEDTARWLWCDALSINQQNDKEKSAQVQTMMKIFSKARQVVAWIGMPDKTTSNCFKAMSSFGYGTSSAVKSPQQLSSGDEDRDPARLMNRLLAFNAQDDHTFPLDEDPYSPYRAAIPNRFASRNSRIKPDVDASLIRQLLRRPYFKRTWVRQEILGAKEVVVRSGPMVVSFRAFADAVEPHLDRHQNVKLLIDHYWYLKRDNLSEITPEEQLRKRARTARAAALTLSQHLRPFLDRGAEFEVSDPRDRLYAVFGMVEAFEWGTFYDLAGVKQTTIRLPPVDYSKSVWEVYRDMTRYLIHASSCLETLEVFRSQPRDSSLPSWAFDWRSDSSEAHSIYREWPIPSYLNGNNKRIRYTKAEPWNKWRPRYPAWSWNRNLDTNSLSDASRANGLNVEGYLLGRVGTLGPSEVTYKLKSPVDILGSDQNWTTTLEPNDTSKLETDFVGRSVSPYDPNQEAIFTLVRNGHYVHRRIQLSGDPKSCSCSGCCVPITASEGDLVVLMKGSSFPFVLRPTSLRHKLQVIGVACFWHVYDSPSCDHVDGPGQERKLECTLYDGIKCWAYDLDFKHGPNAVDDSFCPFKDHNASWCEFLKEITDSDLADDHHPFLDRYQQYTLV